MEAPLDAEIAGAPARRTDETVAEHSGWKSVAFVCLLFVLSGACGLAYEVVWTKYLGLFLGNTVLLHTAVLGTFMGGLALGSLLLGRRAETIASPLRGYGWLELTIAAYAFSFPQLAGFGRRCVITAAASLGPGSGLLLAVKVGVAAALLVFPTVLMGATLPLLTAHLERMLANRDAAERRRLAGDGANWLYFANCAGAVAGTLLCGFSLIPQLGLATTVMGVAIVNAGIGLLAVAVGTQSDPRATRRMRGTAVSQSVTVSAGERRVLAAICLSGATAFLYELVWTRLFAVSLGSSTYSFTLMLAAFITGLALGSAAASVLPVRRKPLVCLAAAELGIGLAISLSLILYPRVPYWCWQWRWMLRATPESLGLYHLCQYALIFLVMAIPTFLFGLTFPMAIRAAAEEAPEGGTVSAQAARVYGWNTIGTLVGVTLAGCVLIPFLGLQRTLQVGAALNLLIAAALLGKDRGSRSMRLAAGAPLGVGLLALLLAPRWAPGTFTYGQFRANVPAPPSFAAYDKALLARTPLFYREDFGTTVAVLTADSELPGQKQRVLVVDGKADATSLDDMPTQRLIGHVPMFLKPDAKDVFLLGLGSGATAGSILTHPGVRRVDCVELSPAVTAAAGYFEEYTHHALHDPRMHLTVDDGKTFLACSKPKQYDLIASEPTNPWIAGVASLFSEESYRSAARALKDDGIVAQWFHTYSLDDALVATIIRTCRRVFPYAVLFQGHQNDYVLIGSRQPLHISFRRMEQELAYPTVAADLAEIHINSVAALLSRQTHTRAAVDALETQGGINTDDLPLLEYLAPDALYVGATAERIRNTDCRLQSGSGLALEAYAREYPLSRTDYRSVIDCLSDPRMLHPALLTNLLRDYLDRWPDDPAAGREVAALLAQSGQPESALRYLDQAARRDRQAAREAVQLRGQIESGRKTVFADKR